MCALKKKSKGLGKGLEALISVDDIYDMDSKNKEQKVQEILLDDIEPNPNQPRIEIDQEKLKELVNSIKKHGVIQPIIVCRLPDSKYRIIAGERRFRACKLAGMKTIPAIIAEYSDVEAAEIALIENLQREDLNPYEEALAYKRLIDIFRLTQEQLAERIGKSRSAIANMLRLLNLPEKILLMLKKGVLSTGHARAILSLKEERIQQSVADEIVKKQLSVRETDKLIKKLEKQKQDNKKKVEKQSPEIMDLQERLQLALGTKVIIKGKGGKGKIEIEFYSTDDLSRILDIIFQEN
ncbi:ParB/RepB/Spo0J family partition protein [Peptococcaceae bacterium]|nr:ParB/RepB/Spo0J family partition protein [Peptococcaceae bacterium]